MKAIKLILIVIFCVPMFIGTGCSKKPDVMYVNGKIYTLDKNNSVVEGLGVRNGKVIITGKSQELTEKYPSVKTVDLKGKESAGVLA